MGKTTKKDTEPQETITVTSSGRRIIKPTTGAQPIAPSQNQPKSTKSTISKNTISSKKSKKDSDDDDDGDDNEQQEESKVVETTNIESKKKKSTTVNRKEKSTPSKSQQTNKNITTTFNSLQTNSDDDIEDDEDIIEKPVEVQHSKKKKKTRPPTPSSPSPSDSPSLVSSSTSYSPARKYTQKELDIIANENKWVYIKFIIFSILMVVVPLLSFNLVNNSIGDYLGINRVDRVTYAGVTSLLGLLAVMVSYSVMAYYEK